MSAVGSRDSVSVEGLVAKMLDQYLYARTLKPNDHVRDPLGRKAGAPLEPRRFTPERLAVLQQRHREWGALYMQNPRVEGAGLLDRHVFTGSGIGDPMRRILSAQDFARASEGALWVRGYDFAFSLKERNRASPDYTVGCKIGAVIDWDSAPNQDVWTATYKLFIADVTRYRAEWSENKARIVQTAREDGLDTWIAGEANGAQKGAMDDLKSLLGLAGIEKCPISTNTNKEDASQYWASIAREGRMWLMEGEWNKAFFDEIEQFPNGTHDDIVDAVTIGAMVAVGRAQTEDPPTAANNVSNRVAFTTRRR